MCEISPLAQKIEQVSENFNTTPNNLKQNDDRNTNMVENNISFLQQELRSKDELIKSLMDTQTMILETISKQNQFKKPDKYLSNFLQYQHKNYIEKVHHIHNMNNILIQNRNHKRHQTMQQSNTRKVIANLKNSIIKLKKLKLRKYTLET